MSEPIKIAIIGAGNISLNFHIPILEKLNYEIVAISDVSENAITTAKNYFKGKNEHIKFHNSDDQFEIEKFNSVLICTPTAFHYPLTKKYLELNKNVFCEKPMCISESEGAELIKLAKDNGLIYQVGYYRRFQNNTNFIKEAVNSGEFGYLESITVNAGWDSKNTLPNSLLNKNLSGGGILIDYGVHIIDRLLSWFEDLKFNDYQDDSKGGVEANCILNLTGINKTGIETTIKLICSWTNQIGNDMFINFENHSFYSLINDGNSLKHTAYNKLGGTSIRNISFENRIFDNSISDCEKQWLEFNTRIQTGKDEKFSSLQNALITQSFVEKCYSNKKELSFSWGY